MAGKGVGIRLSARRLTMAAGKGVGNRLSERRLTMASKGVGNRLSALLLLVFLVISTVSATRRLPMIGDHSSVERAAALPNGRLSQHILNPPAPHKSNNVSSSYAAQPDANVPKPPPPPH